MPSFVRKLIRRPYSLTSLFVAVNVFVYILLLMLGFYSYFSHDSSFTEQVQIFFVLTPQRVVNHAFPYVLTLLTSMFTHVLLAHLLVNMLSLLFVGSFVERLIGKRRYFWLYIISGLAAGAAFILFAYLGSIFSWGASAFGAIDASAVGASGALFGVAGLLMMLLPRLRVLVFFVLPMPLWGAMALLLIGLWIFSAASGLPVGNTAHLGGLIVGIVYGWYLRTKYARKVAALGRMFS